MKRNIFLSVMLIVLFCGLIFGVIYLNDPSIFKSSNETSLPDSPTKTLEYRVRSGEIVHTYETSGAVISQAPEIYIEEITVSGITSSDFELMKNKGDNIAPKETLYKFKGAEKSVDFNAQLVDVEYIETENVRSAVITLLNYDKLYIAAQIDKDRISKITYDTPVEVVIDGQSYKAKITDIGYEITGGFVDIFISLPAQVRPGTAADIIFTLDIKTAGLYVPKSAIYHDGENYYADVRTAGGTEQRKITVGQFFTVEEGSSSFEYVELLSGVSENDVIVVEQIDGTGSKLKEHFENE